MITEKDQHYVKQEDRRANLYSNDPIQAQDLWPGCARMLPSSLLDRQLIAKLEKEREAFENLAYMGYQYNQFPYDERRYFLEPYEGHFFQLKPNFSGPNLPLYEDEHMNIKQQQSVFRKNFSIKQEQPSDPVPVSEKRQFQADGQNFIFRQPDFNQYFSFVPAPSHLQNKSLHRKKKVLAYLEKKKKRCYLKKVIYKCRKDVADGRIRYKGRFISAKQAASMLGSYPDDNLSPTFLKEELSKLDKKKT